MPSAENLEIKKVRGWKLRVFTLTESNDRFINKSLKGRGECSDHGSPGAVRDGSSSP